uniref:Uncharacterized protein n=1 Tax=Romanomermis culicivorax TaxID=13658 RepID=A0A915JFM0_ROMCU
MNEMDDHCQTAADSFMILFNLLIKMKTDVEITQYVIDEIKSALKDEVRVVYYTYTARANKSKNDA